MRADRLVAVLLLLQARGRVTAGEVAAELEVSERTARRDLDALAMAGIPLYSQQGRGGGWELVGGARTDLSGLTSAEARALFLVAGPSSSATPEVKAALRKLVQALPEPFRVGAEAAASAVIVDPARWGREPAPDPPHLDELQQAVVGGAEVRLGYGDRERRASSRLVHPLGLVTKGTVWYLIADTDKGRRTFRVDRVRSVEPTGSIRPRPEGFDLATEWDRIASEIDERRSPIRATVRVDPSVLWVVQSVLGTRARVVGDGPSSAGGRPRAGRVEVEVRGDDVHVMAAELAGFGRAVEVVEPEEVRSELVVIARELLALYAPSVGEPTPRSG